MNSKVKKQMKERKGKSKERMKRRSRALMKEINKRLRRGKERKMLDFVGYLLPEREVEY